MFRLAFAALALLGTLVEGHASAAEPAHLNAALKKYVEQRQGEFAQIPQERKQLLEKLALYVRARTAAGEPARVTFICTHNSRRSHFGQLWAAVAAAAYGVAKVETYSGGTEATAFNPRAVAALERAGFKIEKTSQDKNPPYRVFFSPKREPFVCFSKVYSSAPNPRKDFCAVLTCSHADKSCPIVKGASLRIPITYLDPKAADGTPLEAAAYDERCAQIAREMLYVFSRVKG